MYIPPSFAETDLHTLHDFIEQFSFATLVSTNNSEPFASHLPLLLDRTRGQQGTLIGHMAKANPQWQFADSQNVLAIFHGPHTYISPTWYEADHVVPTWNYVAVHVSGTLRLITDQSSLLDIVRQTVEVYEATLPTPWSMDQVDGKFIERLLNGIVGFEIVIDRLEGKWKLNQNHDESRRDKVIRQLQQSTGDNERQIAQLMADTQN